MIHGTLPVVPAAFHHKFATVNDLRFHYVAGGAEEERTIVLLAGFPES